MEKIYLFGPMKNHPEFNFPAFRVAAHELRSLGFEVFSPAEHDLSCGFDPSGNGTHEELDKQGFDLRGALAADLAYICREADMLVGLPGWEDSAGSKAEVHAAWALRIPVYPLEEFLAGNREEILPWHMSLIPGS